MSGTHFFNNNDNAIIIKLNNFVLFFLGIPSLDIPRLDPASVDRAELKATKGSPVGLELHFSNITFKGFAKANITSVK